MCEARTTARDVRSRGTNVADRSSKGHRGPARRVQNDFNDSREAMMKTGLQAVFAVLAATAFGFGGLSPESGVPAFDAAAAAQPKLLHLSGSIDGSGRIVFTRDRVHYEHRHWGRPNRMLFDHELWLDLEQTPVPWTDYGRTLDLSKAWIAQREGRDVIALEATPDGFDLTLCDSPNGADEYAVTIAIPRRR